MSTFDKIVPVGQKDPNPPKVPYVFGLEQHIEARRSKVSQINIKNPGTISNTATQTGTVSSGSTLFVVDTLTPQAPHGTEMNFAIPYVAVYQGTAAVIANQIHPILGAGGTYGSWSIQSDFDWGTFSTSTPGSIISAYTTQIHNNMNISGTFFYVSQWKYLNLNSGTVT